jgi:hypothetical protein
VAEPGLRPFADALADARRKQAQITGSEPFAHVIGCIIEAGREKTRIDIALRDAVAAIRAGRLDDARQWLDDVDSLAGSLQREAYTALLALSAARDREGI